MAWRTPPKDATDRLLAEEYHLYKTAPGRKPAPSVTKVLSPLTDADMLAQSKAKLTAEIAVFEDDQRLDRTKAHRQSLQEKYDSWASWKHAKYPKVNLSDDDEVYFDWLRMEVTRRWSAKADLGSRVHDHVYELSIGNDVDAQDDEIPYLDAWERYATENDVEFIESAVERVVVHPSPLDDASLEYGGRDDLFCIHHAGDYPGLNCGDYKTGNHYPTKVTLQLCAYMSGLGFAVYDDKGAITNRYDPLPSAERGIAIYLRPDATYEVWPAPIDERTFPAFLDLRANLNFCKSMEPHEKAAEEAWKARKSATV